MAKMSKKAMNKLIGCAATDFVLALAVLAVLHLAGTPVFANMANVVYAWLTLFGAGWIVQKIKAAL